MTYKPPGYHLMDSEARAAFDKSQREKEDAEYEIERAKEEAESARNNARREKERHRAYVADLRSREESLQEELEACRNRIQELQDEVVELETDRSYLSDFIDRVGKVNEFLAWHRTTTMLPDGSEPDLDRFKGMFSK
jgi:chromosome segregation ATPase